MLERCVPPPVPHLSLLALSPSHWSPPMAPEEAGGNSFPKVANSGFLEQVFIPQSISISKNCRTSRVLHYSVCRQRNLESPPSLQSWAHILAWLKSSEKYCGVQVIRLSSRKAH